MTKKILKKNKGFTMVETLIAVAILMIAIAGPLTIAQKGLTSAFLAHDQLTASYLAQDAMEFIKTIKENNKLNGRGFVTGIDLCTSSNPCSVNTIIGDPNNHTSLGSLGLANCNPSTPTSCLLYISNSGYSPTSSGNASKFSRYFYVDGRSAYEYRAVVVVRWNSVISNNEVKYESNIFDVIK